MATTGWKRVVLLGAAVAAFVAFSTTASAQADVYRQTLRSTGWVRTAKQGGTSTATCWLLDRQRRLAITNAHVVRGRKDGASVSIFFPLYRHGQPVRSASVYRERASGIPAKVVYSDRQRDLALLRLRWVPAGIRPLALADEGPEAGETIYTVGNSSIRSGKLWRFRRGKILQVAFHRSLHKGRQGKAVFSSTRPAQHGGKFKTVIVARTGSRPGDSGGPMVNARGRLVGVHFAGTSSGKDVSVHVREVRRFLGRAPGGRLRASAGKGSLSKPAGRS